MPLYTYRCPEGHEDDRMRSVENRNDVDVCFECGKLMSRVISPVRHEILFRPGYYNTVGSHCETEMEFYNKRAKAVDKYVDGVYSGGKKPQIQKE